MTAWSEVQVTDATGEVRKFWVHKDTHSMRFAPPPDLDVPPPVVALPETAFSLFRKDNPELNAKEASHKWKEVSAEQHKVYEDKAKQIEKDFYDQAVSTFRRA
jgi:hypothetical protein